MIYLIGTAHSVQCWSDAKRNGTSFDATNESVAAFENYVETAARSQQAKIIAEAASEEWVLTHGPGASSVAQDVAAKLGTRHLFCDPNTEERRALGLRVGHEMIDYAKQIAMRTGRDFVEVHEEEVRKGFELRESIWVECLESWNPNKIKLLFICGADHIDTLKVACEVRHLRAAVHCRDWTDTVEEV